MAWHSLIIIIIKKNEVQRDNVFGVAKPLLIYILMYSVVIKSEYRYTSICLLKFVRQLQSTLETSTTNKNYWPICWIISILHFAFAYIIEFEWIQIKHHIVFGDVVFILQHMLVLKIIDAKYAIRWWIIKWHLINVLYNRIVYMLIHICMQSSGFLLNEQVLYKININTSFDPCEKKISGFESKCTKEWMWKK